LLKKKSGDPVIQNTRCVILTARLQVGAGFADKVNSTVGITLLVVVLFRSLEELLVRITAKVRR
jgi:hypothetical protein